MCGPYSGGQSHQRQPLLRTCTIPLITRRSSTRSTPRTSVGKCGSIRAHCSSLSQNRFLPMNLSPNTNQYRIVEPERLMSSDASHPDIQGPVTSARENIDVVHARYSQRMFVAKNS